MLALPSCYIDAAVAAAPYFTLEELPGALLTGLEDRPLSSK